MTDDAPRTRFVVALFLLIFAVGFMLMGQLLMAYITPVMLALALLTLFQPLYEWIKEKTGGRDSLATGLTTTAVVLIVVVPLIAFGSTLSAQAFGFYESTKDNALIEKALAILSQDNPYYLQLKSTAASFGVDLSPDRIVAFGADAAKNTGLFLTERLGGLAGNAMGLLLDFGMMIILLAGLFPNSKRLGEYLLDLSPLPDEEEIALMERFREIAKSAFIGNGVASVIQGICGGIGFSLFGLGNGVLWGAAIGFFAFLPIVGASVVVIPASIVLFVKGEIALGIGFVIYNLIYVAIFEYWYKTKLVGGQLNSTLVFFGIVAGLSLYGMLGLFYGPLIVTMFLTLAEIYKQNYRGLLLGNLFRTRDDGSGPQAASNMDETSLGALPSENVSESSEASNDTAQHKVAASVTSSNPERIRPKREEKF
ncbi:MAG: AI-2E family transporter [Deltaproteobacteria bacterium]|nr:AI-2E family transporter [Deltaproteobacteria bacterium]